MGHGRACHAAATAALSRPFLGPSRCAAIDAAFLTSSSGFCGTPGTAWLGPCGEKGGRGQVVLASSVGQLPGCASAS